MNHGESTGSFSDESPETTSVSSVQFLSHEAAGPKKLNVEEAAAIDALPKESALLIAHSGPNQGARFLLDHDSSVAGRHPDADIFLDDVTVSRKHVEFQREGNRFRLLDSGSLNGTYVNGDRVDSVLLRTGSEIQIGKFRLTFYASPAA